MDILLLVQMIQLFRIWKQSDRVYECTKIFTDHRAPVVKCNIHPHNNYVLTVSKDSTWGLYDIDAGNLLTQAMDPDRYPFSSTMVHPDGFIFATGTENNVIRIWDIRTQKIVATFQGHSDKINDVNFSENGIYLATSSMDKSVRIWDLRGPNNICTLNMDEAPKALSYDKSGVYLAVAADREVRVFIESNQNNTKDLSHVKTLDDHSDVVTDLKWGPDAKFLVSSSLDKYVKFWSK